MRIRVNSCMAIGVIAIGLSFITPALADNVSNLTPAEDLGRLFFFDKGLSAHSNQGCVDCHKPAEGFTGPSEKLNKAGSVYEGSIHGRFGNRKPPSAAYATTSPIFGYVIEDGAALFVGGNFWDGRATGEALGNPAADQARGPFLNPVEQALPDAACAVYRACSQPRYNDFTLVWPGACDISWRDNSGKRIAVPSLCHSGQAVNLTSADRDKVRDTYNKIALSIAAFEASPVVNAYTSKFDAYLAGQATLTKKEQRGFALFEGRAQCANCHVLEPGPNGEPPLLTDYTFDNIGVPRNPENPWYTETAFNPLGKDWVDQGLGAFLATRTDYAAFASANLGKQKVPTLRNVDRRPTPNFTKAFMHNGYFKSLKAVVHFYNTRDTKPECPDPFTTESDALAQDCWPVPEVTVNVNHDELGDLGLSDTEEDDVVAFLKTLSDGYWVKP